MSLTGASAFDPSMMDRTPSSAWPARLLTAALVAASGFLLAVLTAVYPLAGVGVVAAIGLLAVSIRMPEVLMVLFTFSLGVPVQLNPLPLNAADGLLVFWCACMPFILIYHRPPKWRVPIVVKAILPFVVVVLLSELLASDPSGNYKQFFRIVEWFVVWPLMLSLIDPTPRLFRMAAILMMLVPCAFAIDGVVEYFNHGNSISHMLHIPVPAPVDTSSATIHHTFDVSGRAGSTFGGAQGLALFLVMFIGVSFAHVIRTPSKALRVLAGISILISFAGLAVAESRGGVMGAMAVVLVIGMLEIRHLGRALAILLLVAILAGLVGIALWPGWDGTIASLVPGGRADAVIDRLSIWRMVLAVWNDNPVIGVGLGNFRDHALRRGVDLIVPLGYESFHAHNTYLEILADTGALGILTYLFFFATMVRSLLRLWQPLRADRQSHAGTFVMAALGTLTAYAVFAAVDMLLLENTHMLVLLIVSFGLLSGEAAVHARAATLPPPASGVPA
jgi:O-antigen ligase